MTILMHGWNLDVDRGPDWLFVRLRPPSDLMGRGTALAEDLWDVVRQHMAHRVVLEMDEVEFLSSHLVGQLVMLHKRLHGTGGLLRLCGLSSTGQQVLQIARLDQRFPHYESRDDAVRGGPIRPR